MVYNYLLYDWIIICDTSTCKWPFTVAAGPGLTKWVVISNTYLIYNVFNIIISKVKLSHK